MNKKVIKESLDFYLEEKLKPMESLQTNIFNKIHHKNDRPRFNINIPVVSTVLMLMLLISSSAYFYLNNKSNEQQTSALISQLENENKKLEAELMTQENSDGLIVDVEDVVIEPNAFPEESRIELEKLNYEGDIEDIKEKVLEQTELIPYEPVLGGVMAFRKDRVKVLSHEWVFAPFDDGHIGGHLLLKYEIKNGEITDWEVVASYLFGE
ncbi:hypothetical protein [Sutcliffiella rhizosphaerae]|uniref:Uncharacterized protein n=1 Tax=Sutcliffiella rhizosphaerae TaxID=2880967 RepID=A0ABN8A5J4_9BACI|nr:hypothetical protein [Sutcliffiella rhizosphaerae]CAG9620390.1 hypothetical protein BACCIP111883_01158 [Sutcliffiella rhizosphaerae]